MKRLYAVLGACTWALVVLSCSLDDDRTNFNYTTLETVSASLPDTFELGRIYNVDVKLLRPDECTFSETFQVQRDFTDSTNIRTIAAVGIVLEEDECAEANDEIQDTFRFEVLYTDPYLFRFYTGDNAEGEAEFLEIEVPVR